MQKAGTTNHQAPSARLAEKAGGLTTLGIVKAAASNPITSHVLRFFCGPRHSQGLPLPWPSLLAAVTSFLAGSVPFLGLLTHCNHNCARDKSTPGFDLSPKPPLRPSGRFWVGWFICWWLAAKPQLPGALPPCCLTEVSPKPIHAGPFLQYLCDTSHPGLITEVRAG